MQVALIHRIRLEELVALCAIAGVDMHALLRIHDECAW